MKSSFYFIFNHSVLLCPNLYSTNLHNSLTTCSILVLVLSNALHSHGLSTPSSNSLFQLMTDYVKVKVTPLCRTGTDYGAFTSLISLWDGPCRKHSPSIVVETCLPPCCIATIAAWTAQKTPYFYCCMHACCRCYLATADVYRFTA
jgi:hypothetical protein